MAFKLQLEKKNIFLLPKHYIKKP